MLLQQSHGSIWYWLLKTSAARRSLARRSWLRCFQTLTLLFTKIARPSSSKGNVQPLHTQFRFCHMANTLPSLITCESTQLMLCRLYTLHQNCHQQQNTLHFTDSTHMSSSRDLHCDIIDNNYPAVLQDVNNRHHMSSVCLTMNDNSV